MEQPKKIVWKPHRKYFFELYSIGNRCALIFCNPHLCCLYLTDRILLRVLTAVSQAKNESQPIQVLAYDLLRETTIPKVTLFLFETIAAVWPSIFVIPSDAKDEAGIYRSFLRHISFVAW